MICSKKNKVGEICWLTLIYIIFTLQFPFKLSCQNNYNEEKKRWSLSARPLLNSCSVKDKNFSSLTYRGARPGALVGVHFTGKNTEHEIAILYISTGNISTNTSPQATLNTAMFNMDYANIYRLYVSPNNLFNCKAGAGIQFLNNTRKFNEYINHNFSFETAISLGVVVQLQYALGKNNNSIRLINRVTLPFLFIFSQPTFSGNSVQDLEVESGSAFKKISTNNTTSSLSKFFRLKNQFAINKNLGNNHSISITYNWEYYKIKTTRSVIASNNLAGIQYSYKF